MEKNLPSKLQLTRDGKLWKNITCTQNSNGRRIERPHPISLLNSSQKVSRCAARRQINSADGSIVAYAPLGSKLERSRIGFKPGSVKRLCKTQHVSEGAAGVHLNDAIQEVSIQRFALFFIKMASIFSCTSRKFNNHIQLEVENSSCEII